MKKYLILIVFVFVATFFIAFAGIAVWWKTSLAAPSTNPTKKEILITKGSNANKIAQVLHENEIIKNELAFRIYVRIYNLQGALPPGQFSIAQNLTVQQVIDVLKKGPNEVWVTIPEGLRREQVPSRFSGALGMNDTEARRFYDDFMAQTTNDEGYLFPETYLVPKDITVTKIITLLKNTFQKKFGDSFTGNKTQLDAIVTFASLLERETRNDSEKPVIAGIIKNRIANGMPLQIDATVQYAKASALCRADGYSCTTWWPTVYLDDYKLKSPFNTYLIQGLPPSPIANPGLTSLQSAQNPETSDYLYYIHDKEGVAHYAKTLPEHNANVQKYLR